MTAPSPTGPFIPCSLSAASSTRGTDCIHRPSSICCLFGAGGHQWAWPVRESATTTAIVGILIGSHRPDLDPCSGNDAATRGRALTAHRERAQRAGIHRLRYGKHARVQRDVVRLGHRQAHEIGHSSHRRWRPSHPSLRIPAEHSDSIAASAPRVAAAVAGRCTAWLPAAPCTGLLATRWPAAPAQQRSTFVTGPPRVATKEPAVIVGLRRAGFTDRDLAFPVGELARAAGCRARGRRTHRRPLRRRGGASSSRCGARRRGWRQRPRSLLPRLPDPPAR